VAHTPSAPLDRVAAAAFRRRLMRWYRAHGRHGLPWRTTTDPYAVLVSEVMLQQTQVERVIPFYEEWLRRWPTLDALAAASPGDAISSWAGMGYYRRPLTLIELAKLLSRMGYSHPPPDPSLLGTVRGIGEYTLSAVLCFAFGRRTVVLDTNVSRVVTRAILGFDSPTRVSTRSVRQAAESLLPARNARDHNLALMDLGALVCRSDSPRCAECPLGAICLWQRRGKPRSRRKPKSPLRFELTSRYARGRILEALRTRQALTPGEIAVRLPEFHRARTTHYLESLRRDGLVVEQGTRWALPV
jgi:A/G-specific adenine glycosylase